MPIYCDESGGIGTGAMVFAAVYASEESVEAVLARYRQITGLRGELKGSRIDLTERGLVIELVEKFGLFAHACVAVREELTVTQRASATLDVDVYAQLLDCAIGSLLPRTGGCGDIIVDDGRYDPLILERVRGTVASRLGNWGRAQLAASHLSAGIQIADVIANSVYNIAIASDRAERISVITQPLRGSGALVVDRCRFT